MKKLLNKVLLLTLVSIPGLFGRTQNVYGQNSLHDSLRHMLTRIEENTNDDVLRKVAREARTQYTSNTIDDSLAKKLLIADSLIVNVVNGFRLDYSISLSYAETLVQVFKDLPLGQKHPDYATSLNNLALLYFYMGKYEKALPLFQKALAIRKKVLGESHPDYAGSLNNAGESYYYMNQYEKALPLFQKALGIRRNALGEEHPAYGESLNNVACMYMKTGQYKKALFSFQQALAIVKKKLGEAHPDYAYYLNNVANLYRNMRQYEKALSLFQQVLGIRKKILGEAHRDYATSINNLALLYVYTAQYEKALPLYQQALAINKKISGEEHPDYARYLNILGMLYSSLGDPDSAAALFTEASNRTLKYLGQTYSALSEQEKLSFLNKESFQFNLLPSVLFTQSTRLSATIRQLYTNELVLKGMVLEDQQGVLNSIRKSGDSTLLQLYKQWRLNKTLLGRQLLLPITERLPHLDSLQDITNQLEQQLSRSTAAFQNLQHSQGINAKDIVEKLQKDEAAVEFISFNLYNKKWIDSTIYAAMVLLPGNSTPHFIPLFEEKQLQSLLKSSSRQISSAAAIRKLYSNDSLYQLIWKPLEKYLAGVQRVYYAPSGLLHRIAFQALQADSIHLLINKYQLNQVLSTRSVALPLKLTNKPASAAVWGNIQYDFQTEAIATRRFETIRAGRDTTPSSFNFYAWDTREFRGKKWKSLAGTGQEISNIAQELQQAGTAAVTDSGTVATEEAFKALDGKSPQVLHIATHGFFLPAAETKPDNAIGAGNNAFTMQQNPMFRSGLVLAGANHAWMGGAAIPGKEDGILTAYEIAQMDLSNTDLVVLSACETALGDLQGNEGVIGLQRAFKMAGVKQLVISLWRVPDKETAELMKMFYGNLLKGQSAREALRTAQLKMKEKYSPYFWAAFVMVE